MTKHDINLTDVERQFGTADGKVRFARFCNAVIVAEAEGPLPSLPRLDDSPGPDGGFDGSWTLPDDPLADNARPFARVGWNAFQFKSLTSEGDPSKTFSRLKQSLTGALQALISRASRPGELRQYTLFTNLNLGRVEASSTATATLSSLRDELIASIREGLAPSESVQIEIASAAELQAIVNQRPALRETFFGDNLFETWDQAWEAMALQPNTRPDAPLVGRDAPLSSLKTKLADQAIGFIGILGASGMGKTRLSLEATKALSAQTFFVRAGAKAAFLAKNIEAYSTPNRSIFVVEDLRPDEAKALAQQAALRPGVCIVASIPAEEHLPRFGIAESRAVFPLRLTPLNSNEARGLLRSVNAKLDHDAFEWVIQEAGGNPQVLLVAAAMGPELRRKTGLLRRQVAQNFLIKAKTLLGSEVEPVLELLSVLSPFDLRKDAHIQAVRSAFGLIADSASVRHFRDRLIDAALAESSGHRGHELTISPPLLAAYLVERVLDGHPQRCLALYEQLDEDGRRRLFERLVSVDSAEGHGLWAHIFGANGPFRDQACIEENQDSLRILARAAPRQTAEFLRSRTSDLFALLGRKKKRTSDSLAAQLADTLGSHEHNGRIDRFHSEMRSIIHELVEHPDSSRVALHLLEEIAVADQDLGSGFAELFTECFVVWNYSFPVPPQELWSIVDRLSRSSHVKAQRIGFDALFAISDPPRNTSAQAVERRRMGKTRLQLTGPQVWDYHVRAFERHLATATKADAFRTPANERLAGALGAIRRIPPARTMPLLRLVERAFWGKKLTLPPASYLGCLIDTRERFSEAWEKYPNAEWASTIPSSIVELDHMMARIDRGPIAIRLNIWIDRHPSFGWKQIPGTDRHRYEAELDRLAAEVAADPKVFTPKMAALLVSNRSAHGADFAQRLGQADRAKLFWSRFAALQNHLGGAWIFGSYCDGVSGHDAAWVEQTLDRAMPKAGANMLMVLKKLGPTPANRQRLLKLVKSKRVSPAELARMFQNGRWLGEIPVGEVQTLLAYIAKDRAPDTTYEFLQAFTLYLHQKTKLPRPLLPLADTILSRRVQHQHDTEYDCDHLAAFVLETSPSAGLRLFKRLLQSAGSPKGKDHGWNPVSGLNGSMSFYDKVRAKWPVVAYTTLFQYLASKNRADVLDHESTVFDLEHHTDTLLRLTKKDPVRALTIARHVRSGQIGFWPLVYLLLEQYPNDTPVRHTLASKFTDDMPWGYLDGEVIDARIQAINRELANTTVPSHGRAFLEQVKAELAKRGSNQMDGDED